MNKEKSKNVFDHIRHIAEVQDPNYLNTLTPLEYKEFNVFLIHRFLGLHNNLTYAMSYIDKYVFWNSMSKEHFYKLLIHVIPKYSPKTFWIKYPKKETMKKPPAWILELIKEYFKFISTQESIEYYGLLTDENKLNLLRAFGISESRLSELQ